MWDYDKIAAEVEARGGIMPTTSFHGYRADLEFDPNGELTEEQNDKSYHWFVREINNTLPEYATWIPATSEIILPIDKVRDLEAFFEGYSWEDVVNSVCEKYLENYDSIIGEDEIEGE